MLTTTHADQMADLALENAVVSAPLTNNTAVTRPVKQSVKRTTFTPLELSQVVACLEDGKAEDITTINLAKKSDLADHLVIASGTSRRHLHSLADRLSVLFKGNGYGNTAIEGAGEADWLVIDGEDFIIHLFRPEVREFYALEKMWG